MDATLILPLLIVLLAVPMFLQARKQKRAMKDQQQLQNSLSVGDRVMTTSGMFGIVVSTSDDNVELEIAPGVITTWVRAAVREKANLDDETPELTEDFADGEAAEEEEAEVQEHDQVEGTRTTR
jgi:preprotein translocase subunit YajC